MAKLRIPEILPTSPMTLSCPFCKAKPDRECSTKAGGFAAVHVQRIVAAAKDTKRKRDDFS